MKTPQDRLGPRPNFGAELLNRIASLVTVGDICSPVLQTLEAHTKAYDTIAIWQEACLDRVPSDPGSYVCLVSRNERIQGWLDFTDLHQQPADATVGSVMTNIEIGSLVSAEMSLLEGMELFNSKSPSCFLVLKGNVINGLFSYNSLFSLPFNACLLMSLFSIEQKILEITKTNPVLAVSKLKPDRRKSIERKITKEQPRLRRIDPSRILECLSFGDLLEIVTACQTTKRCFPLFEAPCFCESGEIRKDGTWVTHKSSRKRQIKALRNALAHPKEPWRVTRLLLKDDVGEFFSWRSELEGQLSYFLLLREKLED